MQREGAVVAHAFEGEAKKVAGRKVLLVEDNPEVSRSTTLMLEELGYQSKAVPNAAQALDELSSGEHFDLVFSDIVMPGDMDGIRLADELSKRRPHLPVLLTSGFSKASASVVPRYPLLRKPFELGELDAALARVLSKSVVVTDHSNLLPFDRKRGEREKD
jgi:CheY-like chemotaxis protein